MSLCTWVASLPFWATMVLLVLPWAGLAAALPWLVRRRCQADSLAGNHDVATANHGLLGAVYGVLLAFVVIMAWQDYDRADTYVDHEAIACLNLYRLAKGLGEPTGPRLRRQLRDYMHTAVHTEFPSLAAAQPNHAASGAMLGLYESLTSYEPRQARQQELYQRCLQSLDDLNENRNLRLLSATRAIPSMMWFVLLVGLVVVTGYPAFMTTSNLRAHQVMMALVAGLLALILVLTASLNCPFTGSLSVTSGSLSSCLERMEQDQP